jgi:DNA-binding MarR family transcriptional regulator
MATRQAHGLPPIAARLEENAFRELIGTLGLVERVQQTFFAPFGLSGAQWGVLRHLQRAEQEGRAGLRLTDLSERLLVRPPSVTGVVDRLERAELVVREGSLTDQRAKQVALTAKGRELVERVQVAHRGQIGTLLGGLSATEITELQRLLTRFRRHLEKLLVRGTAAAIN